MAYTVLVVDDSDMNREILVTLLRRNGYRAIEARDGVEAVEAALHHHPDLILMDLYMPRMDGWDATRHLKKRADFTNVPILAVSAQAAPDDARTAIEAGCAEFINKPIALAAFLRLIQRYLQGAGADQGATAAVAPVP